MIIDTIFLDLNFNLVKVDNYDVMTFEKAFDSVGEDLFCFRTPDAIFKIDKIKKEFRVLHRYEFISLRKSLEHDAVVMTLYKIAKRSGYKVFLEPKFMN
jgi:hypothetical protein